MSNQNAGKGRSIGGPGTLVVVGLLLIAGLFGGMWWASRGPLPSTEPASSPPPVPSSQAPARSQSLYAEEVGETWPFRAPYATVICERGPAGASILTVTVDGDAYALNGVADSLASERGWKATQELGVVTTAAPDGLPKSIAPISQAALALCL